MRARFGSSELHATPGSGLSERGFCPRSPSSGEVSEGGVAPLRWKYGDRVLGVLGVVGPRRMPYAKIVPLVDYTARLVSRRLMRMSRAEPQA